MSENNIYLIFNIIEDYMSHIGFINLFLPSIKKAI